MGAIAPPQKKKWGAKILQISNGAYSSEHITLERKQISARLKRLCNRKNTAYKLYVRPWPLTFRCKHGDRLYMHKCENFGVFCDSVKIFCGNPPSIAHVRQTLMWFTSVENFVNFGP